MANVLFILSGSIACYKACDAISQLVQSGHKVRTVATSAALEFIGRSTLEGLTGEKVRTDLFTPGEALDHIHLSRWAELTVVCPATAHTINRAAAGLADDLAGSLLLAHEWKKPVLFVPAMNPAMASHPATVSAMQRLESWGARFLRGSAGPTACGEVGSGRLAEPDEIVAAIEALLTQPRRRLRVLVTSGGTSEPIDGVRVLTNSSTGSTGALIAGFFVRRGHEVVLVRAASAPAAVPACTEETYITFAELGAVLERRLRGESFDVVIHAAAVGDFSIATVEVEGVVWRPGQGKIPSGAPPTIRLQRNPKLLDALRQQSRNREIRLVAFKLTRDAEAGAIRAAVESVFATSRSDFVVHNDLARRTPGGAFPADIWRSDGVIVEHCADRMPLAIALERVLTEDRPPFAAQPAIAEVT